MTERDESYGAGLAELMNPEVARRPQPIYSMLQASTPIFRLDGVGVVVASRSGVEEVLRNPDVFSSGVTAHDLRAGIVLTVIPSQQTRLSFTMP